MEHSVYPRCTQRATMEANTMQETALLELRGICKFFPGVRALDGVDFTLCKGEIHALMGENGAGKSTLIKVLTGVYSKDEGTISMEGTPVQIRTTQDALKAGISTVYQEITLCPNLTVAENLYIGRTKGAFTNWRKMNAGAKKLLSSLGIPAAPTQQLSSCSIAVQQMVAIARAVDMECKVLILDEPTSSLDEQEVEKLFKLMLDLKSRGVGIIFVTHFLEQVYAVCDRITATVSSSASTRSRSCRACSSCPRCSARSSTICLRSRPKAPRTRWRTQRSSMRRPGFPARPACARSISPSARARSTALRACSATTSFAPSRAALRAVSSMNAIISSGIVILRILLFYVAKIHQFRYNRIAFLGGLRKQSSFCLLKLRSCGGKFRSGSKRPAAGG